MLALPVHVHKRIRPGATAPGPPAPLPQVESYH